MRRLACACTLAVAAGLGSHAHAEHVVRVATIIPDGTSWAREFRAFARDVEAATGGDTRVKIYFGGVAGDEQQVYERMTRGQLDGVFSAGTVCERLAPTFGVMRIPGLFQSRAENAYVLGRIKPDLDKEFLAAGYTNLIEGGVGPDLLFTRKPVASMAELRRTKLWMWDIDHALIPYLQAIGFQLVLKPIEQAARDYDEQRTDGFIIPANAALAWQWTAQVHYFTNLNVSYVSGCFIVANRVFDGLPLPAQNAMRTGSAKVRERVDAVMQALDAQLLGGLLQKHGLKEVPVSPTFRAEFFDAAKSARDGEAGRVPRKLLERVLGLLADFRGAR